MITSSQYEFPSFSLNNDNWVFVASKREHRFISPVESVGVVHMASSGRAALPDTIIGCYLRGESLLTTILL